MAGEIWEELEALWDFVIGIDDAESVSLRPPVNIFEGKDVFLIQVAFAGVPREDIEVVYRDGKLIVKGKRKDNIGNLRGKYHSLEIFVGPFEREISLGKNVDMKRMKMKYENGLLEILIPKVKRGIKGEE